MARPRNYDHDKLRAACTLAARRLLQEGGPGALTARALAREAGATPGTVYALFGSMAGVLQEVNRETFGELIDDETLVYLWHRPVARWKLALAGALSASTVAVPLTAIPLTIAALIASGELQLSSNASMPRASSVPMARCRVSPPRSRGTDGSFERSSIVSATQTGSPLASAASAAMQASCTVDIVSHSIRSASSRWQATIRS